MIRFINTVKKMKPSQVYVSGYVKNGQMIVTELALAIMAKIESELIISGKVERKSSIPSSIGCCAR